MHNIILLFTGEQWLYVALTGGNKALPANQWLSCWAQYLNMVGGGGCVSLTGGVSGRATHTEQKFPFGPTFKQCVYFLHVACQIISHYCDQGVSLLQLIYNFMSVVHMRVTLSMWVVLRSLKILK